MTSLDQFYSFPVYASREDYESKTGQKAPQWDPSRPVKRWADLNPSDIERDELDGDTVTYRPVLSILPNGVLRNGPDGQPATGSMRLPVDVAKSYNFLPPKGVVPMAGQEYEGRVITTAHVANAQREIRVPLTLPEGAKIVYAPGIPSVPVVLKKGESLPSAGGGYGFTDADRRVLQEILSLLKA